MLNFKPINTLLALIFGYTSLLAGQSGVLAKTPTVSANPSNLSNGNVTSRNKQNSFSQPALPSSEGRPGGRVRGGAKRGPCQLVETQLTALVPFTQTAPTETDVWGFTTQANPTFLFYVPYSKDAGYPMEFVLQDQDANIIYEKAIALPDKPGIISVSLPTDAPALAVDKQYRWFLTVECEQQNSSPPIYVEGVIQRVQLKPEITQKLETVSPSEKFDIYAANGIWFDAAEILFQLRQKNPQNTAIENKWRNLLTSISLDDIVTKPVVSAKP